MPKFFVHWVEAQPPERYDPIILMGFRSFE